MMQQQDFEEYDDTITEDAQVPELADLTPEEEADLREGGAALFSSPASSIAELYDQLEYEELGQLDGGGLTAAQELVTDKTRPTGPELATKVYGGYGRSRARDGRVELPEQVDAVRSIPCHALIEDELRKLLSAWFHGHLEETEERKMGVGPSYWPLVKSIKGMEEKLRSFVPARFGDKRISPTSWGLAITVNRAYNRENTTCRNHPAGDPVSLTSVGKPGYSFYDGHPMVTLAEQLGWAWLGRPQYPNGTPNKYPDPAMFAWIRGWS